MMKSSKAVDIGRTLKDRKFLTFSEDSISHGT